MIAELIIIYLFIFIFGAVFGSFFNVCISRIPLKESLLTESHCPNCGKAIKYHNNIPIFSWLFLKGKCSDCSQPISITYFLVELITPLLFIFIFYVNGSMFSIKFISQIVFTSFGIIIAFIDFKNHIIPDVLSIPLLFIGLLFGFLQNNIHGLFESFIGAASGFLLFLIVSEFYLRVRKKEALGGGDIKIMAAIGAFSGWMGVLAITFLASVFALIILVMIKHDSKEHFPFGPFLVSASLFYLIAGRYLGNLYMKFYDYIMTI
jgi:leader peptidase (prepilin peptidase)/N-methyltransferase